MADLPPVLLLPGLLCDAALWRAQVQALHADAACTVADLTLDDRLESMAERALAAMPPRFVVAGLSMGGYVALALLRLAPQRVAALVLFDTSARPDAPEQARRRRGLIGLARAESRAHRFRGVTPRLLPSLVHADRLTDPALGETIIAMADRVGRLAYIRQQTAILHRPDSRPFLPAIGVPTHVVVGDSDRQTPPDHAEELAALIPGARLTVLPRCGHLPPLEQPEAATAILRDQLRFYANR